MRMFLDLVLYLFNNDAIKQMVVYIRVYRALRNKTLRRNTVIAGILNALHSKIAKLTQDFFFYSFLSVFCLNVTLIYI